MIECNTCDDKGWVDDRTDDGPMVCPDCDSDVPEPETPAGLNVFDPLQSYKQAMQDGIKTTFGVGRLWQTRIFRRKQEKIMHYRNGREAKNGDKVVSLGGYGTGPVNINAIGILYEAVPGNNYCNGYIASILGGPVTAACLCDCLHYDDLAALIKEKGWDKRV